MSNKGYFCEKNDKIFNEDVRELIRKFYQKATDNGTVLNQWSDKEDRVIGIPLMQCEIGFFHTINYHYENYKYKRLYKELTPRTLQVAYDWSQGRIVGGCGDFEVNLSTKEIREFQIKLEEIFSNPQKYYEIKEIV